MILSSSCSAIHKSIDLTPESVQIALIVKHGIRLPHFIGFGHLGCFHPEKIFGGDAPFRLKPLLPFLLGRCHGDYRIQQAVQTPFVNQRRIHH